MGLARSAGGALALLFTVPVLAGEEPKPAGLVSGVVVDSAGKPMEGADVWLTGTGTFGEKTPVLSRTTTDAQGAFRVAIPPDPTGRRWSEALVVWAHRIGSAVAGRSFQRTKPPGPEGVMFALGVPAEARFRVVDPDGHPVEGARLSPFIARLGGTRSLAMLPDALADRLAVASDAEGEATLLGFPKESVHFVRVASARFGRQRIMPKPAEAGIITVALAPVGAVSGRLIADDPGTDRPSSFVAMTVPMPGAEPRVGEVEFTVAAEGRFEIPAIAVGTLRIFAPPSGAGDRPRALLLGDRAVEAGKRIEVEVPLDGPGRRRIVEGVVRDGGGQPVAGADVLQSGDGPRRTRTTTDAQGRFRLPGVNEGRAFVFASKDGYRFQGQPVDQTPGVVEVVLTRQDVPPSAAYRTLPPLLSHDEELGLARRLIDPYVDQALKAGDEPAKVRTLEALARVEPARTLELLEKRLFTEPFFNDMLRSRVAEGLGGRSPDEARDVIEAMQSPFAKALAYVQVSDDLPESDRAGRLELFDQAELQVRGTKEPQFRLAGLARVAERLLDLGETERATRLLREGQAVARELPNAAWAGFAKGAFAEELAQVDLAAALALCKDLSDPLEFDRHHGNIAHELASKDPAEAERVLAMVVKQQPSRREYSATRVCYRMARVDLPRARRIAGTIEDPIQRAFTLGVMAQALADRDKRAASRLLAEAFDELGHASDAGLGTTAESPAVVGASLLPAVEATDPTRVSEYLWRSLAFRPPTPVDQAREAATAQAVVTVAMRLARYDRDLARMLLEPFARREGRSPRILAEIDGRLVPVAAAAIDPRWAVDLVEALPDPPDVEVQRPKNRARLAVVQMLTRRGEARWKHLQWNYMHLWVPDQEDLQPSF